MPICIAHADSDGIISTALLLKVENQNKFKLVFSSASKLKHSLVNLIIKNLNKNELYIFDLSGSEITLALASGFEHVIWIDHHVWEDLSVPKNVEVLVRESESAAKLVAEYFGIEDELVKIANEIDRNKVKSKEAKFLRDLISSIKWKFATNFRKQEQIYKKIALTLAFDELNNLKTQFNELLQEFNGWLKGFEEEFSKNLEFHELNGLKIAIYQNSNFIPIYWLLDKIKEKIDILVVLSYLRNKTKIELRSVTGKNILPLAKFYGGGGHKVACGATVNNLIKKEEILEKIKKIL